MLRLTAAIRDSSEGRFSGRLRLPIFNLGRRFVFVTSVRPCRGSFRLGFHAGIRQRWNRWGRVDAHVGAPSVLLRHVPSHRAGDIQQRNTPFIELFRLFLHLFFLLVFRLPGFFNNFSRLYFSRIRSSPIIPRYFMLTRDKRDAHEKSSWDTARKYEERECEEKLLFYFSKLRQFFIAMNFIVRSMWRTVEPLRCRLPVASRGQWWTRAFGLSR